MGSIIKNSPYGGFRPDSSKSNGWTIDMGIAPCKLKVDSIEISLAYGDAYGYTSYVTGTTKIKYIYNAWSGSFVDVSGGNDGGYYLFPPDSDALSCVYSEFPFDASNYKNTDAFKNYNLTYFGHDAGYIGSGEDFYVLNSFPGYSNPYAYASRGLGKTKVQLTVMVGSSTKGAGEKPITNSTGAQYSNFGAVDGGILKGVIPTYSGVDTTTVEINNASTINKGDSISLSVKNIETDTTLVLKSGTQIKINYTEIVDSHTIKYNANGGSGVMNDDIVNSGSTYTVLSNNFTAPQTQKLYGHTVTFNGNGGIPNKESETAINTINYSFSHWNTKSNGTGSSYYPGESGKNTFTVSGNVTLYAQWTSNTLPGSITTATCSKHATELKRKVTLVIDDNEVKELFSEATVTYTCNGWYTSTSGGTKRADSGGTYTPTSTEEVYAQWNSETGSYSSITLPNLEKEGYTLKGWSTTVEGDVNYIPGDSLIPSSDTTLYAIWKLDFYAYIKQPDGSWKQAEAYIKQDGTWKKCEIYVKDNNEWLKSLHKDL